jgi:hypothetical protein
VKIDPVTGPLPAPRHSPSGDPRGFDGELRAAGYASVGAHERRATTHAPRSVTRTGSPDPDDKSDDGANDPTDARTGSTVATSPVVAAALGVIRTAAAAVVRAPTARPDKSPCDEAAADVIAVTAAVDAAEPMAPVAPLTPLEQAVHELLDEIGHLDEHSGSKEPAPESPTAPAPVAPMPLERPALPPAAAHAAPVARTEHRLAEQPMLASHVHLVLDDGPERVVVTVAVRGSDVHVALRANDDLVAGSLARNAAVLDHAMRARGLVLAELQTDTPPERQRRDPEPPPEHHHHSEPFELEETP